jgi:hypothetical protein
MFDFDPGSFEYIAIPDARKFEKVWAFQTPKINTT